MSSVDGIIAVPKGLKQEARRLVIVAFMLAPIGVLAAVAAVGMHGATTSNIASSPVPSAGHQPQPSLTSPTISPITNQTPPGQSSQSSSIELHTSTTPGESPSTQIKVNQQPVDVPSNGSVHKVISSDNGTTTIDVSHSSSSVNDSSSSSTNIQLNTSSSVSSSSQTDTGP